MIWNRKVPLDKNHSCIINYPYKQRVAGQRRCLLMVLALLFITLINTRALIAAPITLLPFETFKCTGTDCPLNFTDPNGSDTAVTGAQPRSKSEGAFLQTHTSHATVGTEFEVCYPANARMQVKGVFQGILRGMGGGTVNRGLVRSSLILRDQTENQELANKTITEREERGSFPAGTDTTIISELTDFTGFDPGIVETRDLEANHVYMLGYRLLTSASGNNALADFNRNAPPRFGRMLLMEIELTPNLPDTDGDGLYDIWETEGLKDCQGNVLVDLPGLGADINHKDIFIEYDWLPGEQPSKASIDRLKQIFADAPVTNPDGQTGIRLWIDTGELMEDGQLVGDNFGGGEEISLDNVPNGAFVPRLSGDSDGNGEKDFFEVREKEYDEARRAVFHYAISGPKGPGEDAAIGRDSCKDGLDNDADGKTDSDDKTDCFGGGQGGGGNFFVSNAGTTTFMHELGHSLGLGHGGRGTNDLGEAESDADNCKPNYLSIMNYSFSGGVPADLDGDGVFEEKTLDFSPLATPSGRAISPLDPLVENKLLETAIMDDQDTIHATRFVDGQGIGRTSAVNQNINWNGENGIEDGFVTANINRGDENGNPKACEQDSAADGHPSDETIISRNDWDNLRYRFPVRASFDDEGPEIIPEPVVTPEEVDRTFFASDLSITKTIDRDPWVAGQVVEYTLTVSNHGPNGVPSAEVVDTPPEGVTFIDPPENCSLLESGAIRCPLAPLPVNKNVSLTLKARLPVIRHCDGRQFKFLTNTATVNNISGRELLPNNNTAAIRHRILCPSHEYATKIVCGHQDEADAHAILEGHYATIVNIHNPQAEDVSLFVKLAQALPPGDLQAGKITPLDLVTLKYDEAAAADCDYVRKKVSEAGPLPEFFDGYLVIQSARSLDVDAVYTRREQTTLGTDGSIDIESVKERRFEPPKPRADLKPTITQTDQVCPSDRTCKLYMQYKIENIGQAASAAFKSRVILQPQMQVVETHDWPQGLDVQASDTRNLSVGFSQANKPEKLCIEADQPNDDVNETNEQNNTTCYDVP